MAQNIGFLNFGIDGDDKAIKAKLDALKKDAVSIEHIFKNIKIDSGGNLSKDTQKAQLSADKLAVSNAKVAQSISDMERASVRLSNEKARSAEIDSRTTVNSLRQATEKQRQDEVALNMEIRKQRVSNVTAESMARKAAIEQKMQEQSLMNEARLEGIRKRNEEIGKRGQENFRKAVDGANNSLQNQNSILTGLEKKLIGVFSTYQIARFAKEVVNVRGEFQGLELAFTTMLGSAEKSRKMMTDVTNLALVSPYTVTEVASNTKQLIAMGIEAEKAMETMKALGDVSAGVSVPMWRVAINYGQVAALGRLQQREIRDFAMAGIPIVDELAKVLGKTSAEITSMVTAGRIGFPEVEKAFQSLSGEGGKFHNMMEKQNSTVKGQMNRLQDQVELMMNSIGKSNEGAIYSTIGMASTLVENYEKVGRSIVALIATYGAYRTALMLATATARGYTLAEVAKYKALLLTEKAQKMLNASMLANPYVLVTTLAIGAATAMWALHDSTSSAERAQKDFSKQQEKFNANLEEEINSTNKLVSLAKEKEVSDDNKIGAIKELIKEYPQLLYKYKSEYDILKNILDVEKEIQDIRTGKSRASNELEFEKYDKLYRDQRVKNSRARVSNSDKEKEQEYKAKRDLYQKAVADDVYNSFMGDLDNLTEKELDEYTTRIAQKVKEGNQKIELEIGRHQGYYTKAIYSLEDAQRLLDSLTSVKDARENSTTYKEDYEAAQKNWREAKKVLEEIEKDKDRFSKEQYEEAKKRLEEADKAFKNLGGKADENKVLEQSKKKTADIDEDLEKARYEKRKQSTDDKLELLKIEEEQELKSIEKKYKDAIVSEEKKNELINLINEKYSVQRADIVKSELEREQELWNKYLAEYGTFQQQKLAVTTEYDQKISKAKSDIEKKSLEKERDTKLSKIEVSAIKSEIDWVTVFGKFGGMFKDVLKDTLAKTKEYTKTDEFKNLDHASQKEVIEALNQMERAVGSSSLSKKFKELGESVQQYHKDEKALLYLRDKEKIAIDKATEALNDYLEALKEGTDLEQDKAKVAYDEAKDASLKASSEVGLQSRRTKESQDSVSESASKLNESMNDVTNGLSKMSSRKLSGIYDGFIQASQGIGGAMGEFADALGNTPVGWILSIIDIFKDGISVVISGMLDAVFSAVSGILSDVLSLDLAVTIADSIRKGVSGIFDAVSFGGFSKLTSLINGGNAKEVQRTTSRLTASNKVLKQSIDALKDEMSKAKGLETVETYKNLKSKEEELRSNTSKLLAAQMGYSNSHHSNNYYIRKAMDSSDWNKISNKVGKNVSSTSDLWSLTPEELKQVSTITEVWDKITTGGKYDKNKYLDDYLKLAGGLEEITKNLQETLTQTTFDDVYSNFLDMLMDMDVSAENFAENFSEYMMKSMLSNKVGALFMDDIEGWYKDFALRMEDGGLSPTDIEELGKTYSDIANEALELRDNLAKASGYDQKGTSKSTLSKGIRSITEDAGDLLASYVNAVRADVAVTKEQLLKIVQMAQLSQTSLGGMLAQLLLIQTNTFNTANNTKEIAGIVRETNDLLKSATTDGGITQFNIR